MVRRHQLTVSMTYGYVDDCIGKYLDERHHTEGVFSGEEVDVIKPNGKLLFALRPGTIKNAAIQLAYPVLPGAARQTTKRTDAAGGRESIPSGTIGYLHGEMTYATRANLPGYERIIPLLAIMARVYEEHCPQQYAVLQQAAARIPHRLIQGTCFTSVAVNRTVQMAVHPDKGNLKDGYGAMTVIHAGKVQGGLLVFPKYLVAVALQNGDCLIADNAETHGNTALECEDGAERVSVVGYFHSSNLTV